MRMRTQLLEHEHYWSISTGSCLTTALTALISLRATRIWRTSSDHSASNSDELMEGVKRGWAHRRQTSLTQAQKKLIPQYHKCLNSDDDYVEKQLKYVRIFYIIHFLLSLTFFFLTTRRRLLSKWPSYFCSLWVESDRVTRTNYIWKKIIP
jgi:hypothetical protein